METGFSENNPTLCEMGILAASSVSVEKEKKDIFVWSVIGLDYLGINSRCSAPDSAGRTRDYGYGLPGTRRRVNLLPNLSGIPLGPLK